MLLSTAKTAAFTTGTQDTTRPNMPDTQPIVRYYPPLASDVFLSSMFDNGFICFNVVAGQLAGVTVLCNQVPKEWAMKDIYC